MKPAIYVVTALFHDPSLGMKLKRLFTLITLLAFIGPLADTASTFLTFYFFPNSRDTNPLVNYYVATFGPLGVWFNLPFEILAYFLVSTISLVAYYRFMGEVRVSRKAELREKLIVYSVIIFSLLPFMATINNIVAFFGGKLIL